jgi:hypothetical protein
MIQTRKNTDEMDSNGLENCRQPGGNPKAQEAGPLQFLSRQLKRP